MLNKLLTDAGASIAPLFGITEERADHLPSLLRAQHIDAPDLSKYYRVDAPDDQLDQLAAALRAESGVVAAYVKPPAEPAELDILNTMRPSADEAPPATPDYSTRQLYLDAAPGGVDARYAWTVSGGSGAGVGVVDVEGAWRFTHEDLTANQGGVVGGTQSTDVGWRNHGTAVIGEIGGDRNTFGIVGISPDATVRAVSIFGGLNSAGAIRRAADVSSPGDILLIELHRPGPRATGVGQQGYIAMEWWPDDYAAIRYAVARGVIVVEAAGNGAEDLDNAAYNTPAPGFPPTWSNPFRRGTRDSGAILVGAGAPPPGTHGRNWGPDRSRLDFSNYGSAVDVQGWGREVTTTGYGDLQGGTNEDAWYTDQFSGTSSASPIIVGVLACTQGALRAAGRQPLTAARARDLLRSTGSPQQDAPGRPASQRIGNRPNLRAMFASLGLGVTVTSAVALHRYWNPAIGDHFYTTSWSELGPGKHGWNYEGVQCYIYPSAVSGTVPLYRYWNPTIGDHFYTTSWAELGPGKHGWNYEGVQGYVYPSLRIGTVPLYRYWNPSIGDHFYTTSWGELGLGRHGWNYEGVQCYVRTVAAPPSDDTPAEPREEEGTATAPTTPFASFDVAPGGGPTPPGALPSSFDRADSNDPTLIGGSFTMTGQSSGQQPDSFTVSGQNADQRANSFTVSGRSDSTRGDSLGTGTAENNEIVRVVVSILKGARG
ncbi:MAG: S8 family serine peptidase [Polyangiaceae bacterium]|nr:S8 family serine peptidase [Polyangiaceae bacterium]